MCNPTNRFTISGDAGSINGPHLKGFVGSDSENSVWQQLNWDKDSISTGYDMYFDGNNWISSQSNANFLLQKSGGKLACIQVIMSVKVVI